MAKSQVVVEMSSDEAKLWASLQKMTRATGDMEKGFAKAGKASKEVKDGADKIGETLSHQVRHLAGHVTQWMSIGAAVHGAVDAIKEYNAASREAAEREKAGHAGMGSLAQYPEQAQLRGFAAQLVKSGAAGDLNQAARQIYTLRSSGKVSAADVELLAKMGESKLFGGQEAETMAEARRFGGQDWKSGKRGAADVLGQVLSIKGAVSSGMSPEEILTRAKMTGLYSSRAGWSEEESLAVAAMSGNVRGKLGGENFAEALAQYAATHGLRGKGLESQLASIEKLPVDQQVKLFGKGFNVLATAGGGKLGAALAAIRSGGGPGALDQALAGTEADVYQAGVMGAEREKGGLEESMRTRGAFSTLRERVLNRMRQEYVSEGRGPLASAAFETSEWITSLLTTDRSELGYAKAQGRLTAEESHQFDKIEAAANALLEASKNLKSRPVDPSKHAEQ